MKPVRIRTPGGLARLEIVEIEDAGAPKAGEIRVRCTPVP